MRYRGFTLVEMIMVIVVLGILSAGTFVSLKHMYQRVAKSKAISELSFDSQIIVNQISMMLRERVPRKVWGYETNATNKTQIHDIVGGDFVILEWYGTASESLKAGHYSGFVDMDASDRDSNTIVSYDINRSDINTTLEKKFGRNPIRSIQNSLALVFAGSFDEGASEHNITDINETDINKRNITLQTRPNRIYEKYFLVDSAYAIARGDDINCRSDANETNTLYLFYNYRPWNGDTFCSDANVTILSSEVSGFEIDLLNGNLLFNLTMQRSVPKRGNGNNVTISKQKVVF